MSPSTEMRSGTSRLAMVSVVIALFSLGASMFQSVNYLRSIDNMQRNILRTESLRTCRDLIDTFFRFRLKAEATNAAGAAAMEGVELRAIAYQFGALGTFLANFHADAARQRYTAMSWHLNMMANKIGGMPKDELEKLFAEADRQFGAINEDCVKAATGHLL